jgi:sirohydrochlorin ferrochelatase
MTAMEHRAALIVTHGQPSDPDTAEAALARLAAQVAAHLPGWQVGSATLAAPGALAQAVARLGPRGVVYPLFMACGWFTGTHLPDRMAAVGGAGWRVAVPFGCTPAIQQLAVTLVREALTGPADKTDLILAAHGSGRSPAPAVIATFVAARIQQVLGLRRVTAAFIDQAPKIADLRDFGPTSICLPYFAAGGGHVTEDIPQALVDAGFLGRLLPPLGLDRRNAAIIAEVLRNF